MKLMNRLELEVAALLEPFWPFFRFTFYTVVFLACSTWLVAFSYGVAMLRASSPPAESTESVFTTPDWPEAPDEPNLAIEADVPPVVTIPDVPECPPPVPTVDRSSPPDAPALPSGEE